MPKGIFAQCVTILLKRPVSLDEICQCLQAYQVVAKRPDFEEAFISGPSVVVAYKPELPELNGQVLVDVFPAAWPDHMGDPKTEPMLMGAWAMGHFGPATFPGGLQRTLEQLRGQNGRESWPALVQEHTAVLRLRLSYVFGAGEDAPIIPAGNDPEDELNFLTQMAIALAPLDGYLSYFNPNGEVILPPSSLANSYKYNDENKLPALDIWSNIRLFNVNDGWTLMDTVGNSQLDLFDHEATFPKELFEPHEVANFLRNATLYILRNGDVIKDGDTMGGPGQINWQAHRVENGAAQPPRPVLRWQPCGLKASGPFAQNAAPQKKPFWKFW